MHKLYQASAAISLMALAVLSPIHAETYTATNVVVSSLTQAHWTQGAPYTISIKIAR